MSHDLTYFWSNINPKFVTQNTMYSTIAILIRYGTSYNIIWSCDSHVTYILHTFFTAAKN